MLTSSKLALAVALAALVASGPRADGPTTLRQQQLDDDIDAFMKKVLERREINWGELYNYVFREAERLLIGGLEIAALESFERDYTWYVRDGYLVRSPWKVDGIEVSDAEREEEELDWIENIKQGETIGEPLGRIERDNFFDFEFEPGNYFFAGREVFEGREVIKIEYYPTNLFSDGDEENREAGDEDEDFDEEEFEHMFDKTSLVTMLVLPEEYQIVKWTFENVGFEFLPGRWLVRIEELYASMVMDEPIEGVWLPRRIWAAGVASTAAFELTVEYSRDFSDYKQTGVDGGVIFGRPKTKKKQ